MQSITQRVAGGVMAQRKRGERDRTGKEKPIGAGAGNYLRVLREMQNLTRESVEIGVATLLGKSTPIGHATLIGIERGARMPSYDIIGGILTHLRGDWGDLFDLMRGNATEEAGRDLAIKRLALNVLGGDPAAARQLVGGLDEEGIKRIIGVFSDNDLRQVVDRMIDNPEAVRIIRAVLDARGEQ